MKHYSITELAKITGAQITSAGQGGICGVSIDSRTVNAGDCFFAIKGGNFDGHDFVEQALENGAACAVVSKNLGLNERAVLKVDDVTKALGLLAKDYRRDGGFKVVGITGSVGKTSTRNIIAHALSGKFKVFQSPKNFNNDIGLPMTLLSADPDVEIIVAELGSNYPGEISYLTNIAGPDIAVVTNVSCAHLEGFGDIETIAKEKLSIADGLAEAGGLIINKTLAEYAGKYVNKNVETEFFKKTSKIKTKNYCSSFFIEKVQIELPSPGAGVVENAQAAWCVCRKLGLNIEEFASSLKTMPDISQRGQVRHFGSLVVIDDCYNANPASMKNALSILNDLSNQESRRAVFICGDMAELGGLSKQLHEELGEDIARFNVRLLISVGEYSKIAGEKAKETASCSFEANSFEDNEQLCNNLDKFINSNDIVLVKGSRSGRLELAVEKLKEIFS